jgi:hypothetical protein
MQQIKMMVRQEMGQMMSTLMHGRAAAAAPVWELPDAVRGVLRPLCFKS